jgi:hypothetical protein
MAPSTRRFGLPYVWVTWVTKLLAGEDSCAYAPWFKAHFKFTKVERGFDFAGWKAGHAAMVAARVTELVADGWTVTVEDQNEFKLKGRTALLSGKADIVARRANEMLVVDCKGGNQKDSDWWQVALYLVALPRVWREDTHPLLAIVDPGPGPLTWRGEVCYADHRVDIVPAEVNGDRQERIFAQLREVGGETAPHKVPSRRECSFCDISKSDCPERVEQAEAAMAEAAEF